MKKLTILLALALLSASAAAQKADFNGEWKLNREKSQLGYEFSLASRSIVIDQKRKSVEITKTGDFNGQEIVNGVKYTLDGKEVSYTAYDILEMTGSANLDKKAGTLRIITKTYTNDMGDVQVDELYSLKEGQMVVVSTGSSSYGEMVETLIYDKL